MKLIITINLENAAFEDNEGTEAARILKNFASQIEDTAILGDLSTGLKDLNGNAVGRAIVR